MSDLVERVKAAIDSVEAIRNEFGDWHDDTDGEARAAIKAVAEWLEAQSKDDRSSANMVANVLFDQLEAK